MVSSCINKVKDDMLIHWTNLPALPPVFGKTFQPGLAGPVAGASGKTLMLAGGANFEDTLPWRGGHKSYHDEIFLLQKESGNRFLWRQAEEKLPYPMAYSVCLSIREAILCIGGENENGPLNYVFRFEIKNGHVVTSSLPSLQVALTSSGAACIENKIYLAGGLEGSSASNLFLTLDLDNLRAGWQRLPDLPVALSNSVVVSQNDGTENCLYVIGGRNNTSEVHTFFSTIWKYSPSKSEWMKEGDIYTNGKPIALAAGTGVATGNNRILLFGGDPGIFFNLTERLNNVIAISEDTVKKHLVQAKDTILTHHPGFSQTVLVYNTWEKSWEKAGEIPGDSPATTVAFYWDDKVIIPNGEVRPGVRTPEVLAAEIN